MKATLNKDRIEISFKYNPKLIAFVKSLPSRKYNPSTKSWWIPIENSLPSIEKLAQWKFDVDPAVVLSAMRDKGAAEEAEAVAALADVDFSSPLPLFPYQKVGCAFLMKIGSGLLGDELSLIL